MNDRPQRSCLDLTLGILLGLLVLAWVAVGFMGFVWVHRHGPSWWPGISYLRNLMWAPFGLLGLGGLIQLVLAVWVAVDANRRGMSGVLWGVLVFFTTIVGLVVYLIVVQMARQGPARLGSSAAVASVGTGGSCSGCGAQVQAEYRVCPHCGHSLAPRCGKCGRPVEKDWKICPHCATPLGGAP